MHLLPSSKPAIKQCSGNPCPLFSLLTVKQRNWHHQVQLSRTAWMCFIHHFHHCYSKQIVKHGDESQCAEDIQNWVSWISCLFTRYLTTSLFVLLFNSRLYIEGDASGRPYQKYHWPRIGPYQWLPYWGFSLLWWRFGWCQEKREEGGQLFGKLLWNNMC